MTREDLISSVIVSAAYRIGQKLGPGLIESAYKTILARDLAAKGLQVEIEKWISFDFEGLWFENAFRIDLLVEGLVFVEVKAKEELHPLFYRQILTYLKLRNCKLGFLINFGNPVMKDGIRRVVNKL